MSSRDYVQRFAVETVFIESLDWSSYIYIYKENNGVSRHQSLVRDPLWDDMSDVRCKWTRFDPLYSGLPQRLTQ